MLTYHQCQPRSQQRPQMLNWSFTYIKTLYYVRYFKYMNKEMFEVPKRHPQFYEVAENYGFEQYLKPKGTLAGFELRFRRGDVEVKYDPSYFINILPFVLDKLYFVFKDRRSEPIMLNYSTAAGYPFQNTTKLIVADIFGVINLTLCSNAQPLIRALTKEDELLPKAKLLEKGPRIFYNVPLDQILKQKFYFGDQNKSLRIDRSGHNIGSCIGWNRWYGGVDSLMVKHAQYKYHIFGDTLSQDLRFPLQPLIYVLRERFNTLRVPTEVVNNIVEPLLLLPNGQVVQKKNINISGSNNTTEDNTLGYFILISQVFFEVFGRTFSREFNTCQISIYGDDWLVSTDYQELTCKKYWIAVWEAVGLQLKFWEAVSNLEAVEFLGCFPKLITKYGEQFWVATPRMDKILSSLAVARDDLTEEERCNRHFSLVALLAFTDVMPEVHRVFKELYPEMVYTISDFQDLHLPIERDLKLCNLVRKGYLRKRNLPPKVELLYGKGRDLKTIM